MTSLELKASIKHDIEMQLTNFSFTPMEKLSMVKELIEKQIMNNFGEPLDYIINGIDDYGNIEYSITAKAITSRIISLKPKSIQCE